MKMNKYFFFMFTTNDICGVSRRKKLYLHMKKLSPLSHKEIAGALVQLLAFL